MKKAKVAIATYSANQIYSLQLVNCKGEFITLIGYKPEDMPYPKHKKATFKSMLRTIITLANNNGYEIERHDAFGTTFYNIALVNLDDVYGTIQSGWSVEAIYSE